MKKLVSLALAVGICLTAASALTACRNNEPDAQPDTTAAPHEHTYQAEWEKDATHHWHVCTDEGCADVSDKAEHTYNGGEITKAATKDADGVRTFTCTACGQTKTEAIEYIPNATVTEEQWRAALASELFYNVTLSYSGYRYDEEAQQATCDGTSVMEYDGDLRREDGEEISANSGDMDSAEIATIVGMASEEYANASYDTETKRYTTLHYYEYYEMNLGLVLQFADGELVRFEYHFLPDDTLDGLYTDQWYICEFSHYGTTDVPAAE